MQHSRGPGILLALAYNTFQFGSTGLIASLIGCFLPFVMLIALYAGRSMGAGDIKALMALGTLWGASVILQVIMWSLVIGGVVALVILLFHGELLSMLRRWGRMVATLLVERQFRYEPPTAGEAAAGGLPFGIAIGLAVAAVQLAQGGII
ncbi:MAG: prepilin peptidase [Deltaproteobacteria bacterium]|nr:prepilin peptidase [Deltaproteobacteria bacterium]